MPELRDVARHGRSKNAGPFWVTIDIFFKDEADFDLYAQSPALGPELFARLYGADPTLVTRVAVRSRNCLNVSAPRSQPHHRKSVVAGH